MKAKWILLLSLLCLSTSSADWIEHRRKAFRSVGGGGTIGPISVANDAGDGEIWTEFFWSDGEDNNGIGKMYQASGDPVWCFYRFVLPSAITSGATITSATIELWGEGTAGGWTNGESDLFLTATDSGNAGTPATGDDRPTPGNTAVTTANVTWLNITWTTDAYNASASITSIIQELVNDNSGLASGAAIVIWISGVSASTVQAHSQLNEFVGETNVARLTISWTP